MKNIINQQQWDIMKILLATWLKRWEDYSKINESTQKIIWKLLDSISIGNNLVWWNKYNIWEIEDLLKNINWKNAINAISGRIWKKQLSLEEQQGLLNNFII